jgi:hypothetical protein
VSNLLLVSVTASLRPNLDRLSSEWVNSLIDAFQQEKCFDCVREISTATCDCEQTQPISCYTFNIIGRFWAPMAESSVTLPPTVRET